MDADTDAKSDTENGREKRTRIRTQTRKDLGLPNENTTAKDLFSLRQKAAARYLLLAPPNGQVWHKAFFSGSVCRAGAHTRPAWTKIPSAPSRFPLLGVPQAPGNKPNPPEGSKSLGDGPLRPEEISNCRDILGQIRAAASTAGRSATQQLKKRSVNTAAFISAYITQKAQGLEVLGEGKGAVILFYIF